MVAGFLILLVFVSVTGVAYWVLDSQSPWSQKTLPSRLERVLANATTAPVRPVAGQANSMEPPRKQRPELFPTLAKLLNASRYGERLRLELVRAGLRLRPAEFVVVCLGTMSALGAFGLIQTHELWLALVLGGLGAAIPVLCLWQRQEARRRRFDMQIPDTLTMIASSLRSGYSFLRALQMVAEEMPAPISEEFGWLLTETKVGIPLETALAHTVENVRSTDLELVATAISIQAKVGGNLAEILDTIAETIRERVRIQGEIKSLTGEGKLSGIILFLLPVFLAILLNARDPKYFQPLLDSPYGPTMIGGALLAQFIGGIIIKKMVTIEF